MVLVCAFGEFGVFYRERKGGEEEERGECKRGTEMG